MTDELKVPGLLIRLAPAILWAAGPLLTAACNGKDGGHDAEDADAADVPAEIDGAEADIDDRDGLLGHGPGLRVRARRKRGGPPGRPDCGHPLHVHRARHVDGILHPLRLPASPPRRVIAALDIAPIP